MTVLPRNPAEMPTKALAAQSVMSGRPNSNGSSQPDETGSEGSTKFATLLGAQDTQGAGGRDPAQADSPIAETSDGLAPAANSRAEQGLENATPFADPASTGAPGLEGGGIGLAVAQQSISNASTKGPIRVPAEAVFSGGEMQTPSVDNQAAAAASQPEGPIESIRSLEPGQLRRGELAVALSAQAGRSGIRDMQAGAVPAKADAPAPGKPGLEAARLLADTVEAEHSLPKAQMPQEPGSGWPLPQARLDASIEGGQVRPASVQADVSGQTVQPASGSGSAQSAVPTNLQPTGESADDLTRLQDVKVLGTRVIEQAPGAGERPVNGVTVKVIDLQLQPDTLGRIGAQLKQSGDVLEVRLEPSLAETALLLKEDRLALQRILGALGSVSDPAVVRIVDPVAEQRQTDEQEALAGLESGETEHGSDQFAAAGDLQDEEYRRDDMRGQNDEDDQMSARRDDRRASGDIYI